VCCVWRVVIVPARVYICGLQEELRKAAQAEAASIIKQEEDKSNMTIQDLEEKLKSKQQENNELSKEREAQMKEYEKQLDKIKRKRCV